jgi:hypothetical protein
VRRTPSAHQGRPLRDAEHIAGTPPLFFPLSPDSRFCLWIILWILHLNLNILATGNWQLGNEILELETEMDN